uniref:Uncharacterized protein n=1 Tax=Glossina brevipalpis TaxID=37001 RepID=A0A1A9W4W7_9MUSC
MTDFQVNGKVHCIDKAQINREKIRLIIILKQLCVFYRLHNAALKNSTCLLISSRSHKTGTAATGQHQQTLSRFL